MDLIPSFQVDHTDLKPGIYVSRTDIQGDVKIITFDLRMTSPNREPAINIAAMHTLEHLIATYLRNREGFKDTMIYFGPMGCLTGSYLIVSEGKDDNRYTPETLKDIVIDALKFVEEYEGEVPGTTPQTCGNYLMHDLPMAKYEAARYRKRLEENFVSEYPKAARPVSEEGIVFHDA